MEKEKKKNTEDEITPIIDGDARPDIDLEGKGAKEDDSKDTEGKLKQFSINRASDDNKLENYKDEK